MKKLNLILAAFVLALIGFTACDEQLDTTVHVEGIEITAPADEAITMKVGETQTLTVVVTPDKAEDKTFSTVSSDAAVVSVDEANLVIKAEKEGTATITVTTLEKDYTFTDVLTVTVVKDAEPATYDWYLVGTFNEWTVADAAYGMAKEGDWYVFKNFVAAEGNETKFNAGSWDVNRGGDFTAANEAIAVAHNGNNIKVPAGTYDVYLCADEAVEYAFFMTPGEVPTHPQEPVVEEMSFEITAEYTTYEGIECWVGTVVPSDQERYYVPGYISQAILDSYVDEGALAEATIEAFVQYQSDAVIMLAAEYNMPIEEVVAIVLEDSGAQGTVQIPTDVMTGKNYFLAFTLNSKGEVEGLEYLMFHEEAGETPGPGEGEIVAVSIAEFLAAEVDATVWFQLTGTVKSIANTTYGNLTIEDETGEVYIYGLTSTQYSEYVYNEEKDRWSWTNNKSFSEIGLAEGDVVTIVGTRGEYNGSPQVGGAYYVSHETPGGDLLNFTLEIVETTTNDIVVAIDAPEELPLDEYGEPMQYIVRWAPASEIGELSDEELFQRELDVFTAEYEAYADASWWSYSSAVTSFATFYGDVPSEYFTGSLKLIANQVQLTIKDGVEYEVYVYAVEIDEEAKTCRLLTNIARAKATTVAIEKVEMSFEFGWDRITYDSYGLSAYVSVTPSNNDQLYTFYAVNGQSLQYMTTSGATEMDDAVAEEVLKSYVQQQNGGWWPVDPAEWTYKGYAFSSQYDALTIRENTAENINYILAAALDEEYNICSEITWEKVDVTGLESTDEQMNIEVIDNGNGAYTYSTNPTGLALENGYILTTIAVSELEKYLDENYYYDYEVSTYANDVVKKAIAELMETQGLDRQGAVYQYLLSGEGAQFNAVTKDITVTEDTYVIAYTLYERSATLNGLEYELMEAVIPEATVVNLTEEDGVQIAFNSENVSYQYVMNFTWNGGNIRFRNNDGTFSYETYEYTNTKHIILDQVYSMDDEVYNVYDEYTYLGEDEYDENGVKAKKATLVVTDNGDGTYTVTADVLWKDQTHYEYIYTGPIHKNLIYGSPKPMSFDIDVDMSQDAAGIYTATITPSEEDKYYMAGYVPEEQLKQMYEAGAITEASVEAYVKEYESQQFIMYAQSMGMGMQEFFTMWAEDSNMPIGVYSASVEDLGFGKHYFYAYAINEDYAVEGLASTMFKNKIDTSVPIEFVASSLDITKWSSDDYELYFNNASGDGSAFTLELTKAGEGTYSIADGGIWSSWTKYMDSGWSYYSFETLEAVVTATGITATGILQDGRTFNFTYEGAVVFPE